MQRQTIPLFPLPTTATFLMFSKRTGRLFVGFELIPVDPLIDPVLRVLGIGTSATKSSIDLLLPAERNERTVLASLWSSPTNVEATERQSSSSSGNWREAFNISDHTAPFCDPPLLLLPLRNVWRPVRSIWISPSLYL